jgi:hypothetical protein
VDRRQNRAQGDRRARPDGEYRGELAFATKPGVQKGRTGIRPAFLLL